jgi:hypothetical protein
VLPQTASVRLPAIVLAFRGVGDAWRTEMKVNRLRPQWGLEAALEFGDFLNEN